MQGDSEIPIAPNGWVRRKHLTGCRRLRRRVRIEAQQRNGTPCFDFHTMIMELPVKRSGNTVTFRRPSNDLLQNQPKTHVLLKTKPCPQHTAVRTCVQNILPLLPPDHRRPDRSQRVDSWCRTSDFVVGRLRARTRRDSPCLTSRRELARVVPETRSPAPKNGHQ